MTLQTLTEILIAYILFGITCTIIAVVRYYIETRSYLNELKKQVKK